MTDAVIRAIESHFPAGELSNEAIEAAYPEWSAAKIESKTGICSRNVAAPDELASDLAIHAAERLFERGVVQRQDIDFILLCTQSPDYLIPTTACLLQDRLGLPTSAGALDFNLGCSGFVYGLSLAKGLVETEQARSILLLTAETYSKHLAEPDIAVRSIFGDAAAATLVTAADDHAQPEFEVVGPFVFGTDGRGGEKLILRKGSLRESLRGDESQASPLSMNGPDVFAFTLKAVPASVNALLQKSGKQLEDINLFVFHQANEFMLEGLRRKLKIPPERFVYALKDCGNTVSSTIPIALAKALETDRIQKDDWVMLVGFGVGYSWAATLLRWRE